MWKAQKARFPHSHNHYCYCRFFSFLKHNFSFTPRLTVGVDLGDQWSHYWILGLQGETLSEGQLQTREAEVAEFFQALPPARVVMEVGTHSPWMQEIIAGECNCLLWLLDNSASGNSS